jgi:hypothetical protein
MNSEIAQILNENAIAYDEVKKIAEKEKIRVRELKPSPNLYLLTKDESQFNGIILEKNTNKIVCAPTSTFENGDNQLPVDMSFDVDQHTFEYCEDGTIIRLYNYEGTWFTATTKCIDAKYSYWATPKTFDELFWITIGSNSFLGDLDPKLTYLFVLLHQDNRIVINHTQSKVVFLGAYYKMSGKVETDNSWMTYTENEWDSVIEGTLDVDVKEKVVTVEDLIKNYSDNPKRGIVVTNKETKKRFKIDFPSFTYLSDLRGNTPFIGTRYLELLKDPKKLEELQKYWPEESATFLGMWNGINMLIKNVHFVYYQTHIKRIYTIDEKHPYYRTIRQLHAQYKLTKKPITPMDVWNKISNLPTYIVSKLLSS